ncbi:hypothetical protein EV379_0918 [Microterricola gilva]|uniref:Uncharacterized protein n=1 Tax=Microterricola gilva TaxID=393267 RepID=A0A4Q8AL51_9MICO|nr:hypothetical protein EV379_0918 [Microterricola gilva]
MICAQCGGSTGSTFVVMFDYCSRCQASPFIERVPNVHAHDAEDGPGRSCPERLVNGLMFGACMLADEKGAQDPAHLFEPSGSDRADLDGLTAAAEPLGVGNGAIADALQPARRAEHDLLDGEGLGLVSVAHASIVAHAEHVELEAWWEDCTEGECDHRDEDGEPTDLTACPSFMFEVCVDCMAEEDAGREPGGWNFRPLLPWPHPGSTGWTETPPTPEPALFKPRPEPHDLGSRSPE